MARGVKIGEGSIVLPGAIVEEGAEIGNFCIIDPDVVVRSGEKIEEYTHLTAQDR